MSAKYAHQRTGAVDASIYFRFFPSTNSFSPEIMVSDYQEIPENEFRSMTNLGAVIIDYAERYGSQGLEIYAHSRGSMTWFNAMAALDKGGETSILSDTDVHYYGPLSNA
ncbi:hypothetical protein H3V13_00980 [Bartonella sp. M0280]|uniref:hypothetical protein n=1 Tax=Bartonella apihabitans TaxID=2750929 RepID=UPI0018DCC013|nr:hypothetical protein [Bartonella apihabitans]MBI0166535.1 hypothetical protein [Bartonella apihabitans]